MILDNQDQGFNLSSYYLGEIDPVFGTSLLVHSSWIGVCRQFSSATKMKSALDNESNNKGAIKSATTLLLIVRYCNRKSCAPYESGALLCLSVG